MTVVNKYCTIDIVIRLYCYRRKTHLPTAQGMAGIHFSPDKIRDPMMIWTTDKPT